MKPVLCSLCRFNAWGTISLSYICMSECTPTDWFCLQSNRFHALPLCVISPWISNCFLLPDNRHCYHMNWFDTGNPTCTGGIRIKQPVFKTESQGLRQRNVGRTRWCFWVSSVFCLAITLIISYQWRKTNFIFTKWCEKTNSVLNFSDALGMCATLD